MASLPLIIINNIAARARRAWPIVRARLEQSRIDYDLYETKTAGDATIKTHDALERGCQLIGVVGGDGTLNETANGYFRRKKSKDGPGDILPEPINPEATLAILPAGTGDDFARNLMGRRAPLDYWIETFVAHCRGSRENTTRMVDAIRVRVNDYRDPFICLNASTLGLGGETAARVAAQGRMMRQLSGEARFVAAAMGALAAWRERRAKIQIDHEIIEGPMNLVAVANARYAGGGMMLSPQAEIDDGKLDVVAASGLTRATILRELTRIHKGGHIANPKVKIVQGRYANIQTFAPNDALRIEIDGNVRGHTPADYLIMPLALRICDRAALVR
jgi:diacylglycerol kinase (ATP)